MATKWFKGGLHALKNGDLDPTPDIRGLVFMAGSTIMSEAVAEQLADFTTIDEYDGAGYSRHDFAGVAWSWNSTDECWEVHVTDDADAFGATVSTATDDSAGLLYYLYVDGTAANDIPIAATTDGFPFDPAGGAFAFSEHVNGILRLGKGVIG